MYLLYSIIFSSRPSVFSLQASPRVQVDEVSLTELGEILQKDDPTPEIFDEIQRKVMNLFLQFNLYVMLFHALCQYIRNSILLLSIA